MIYTFDSGNAMQYGIHEAIILDFLEKITDDLHETKTHSNHRWTRCSLNLWHKYLPFMSVKTIRKSLDNLVDIGVVLSENLNDYPCDRTLWYTIK